ncbi:MAG: class A beta-lactamase-related serine hydrolase, partial [Caulobacteraceae bacterium]|nr:class A beta-lactamase-related serine hydrolase [Caulobacteraceae bacterium]
QISDRARALGYCAGPVRAEPGDGFASFGYNNCDYLVLGAILGAVTGKSYAALLRDQISRPLGLKTIKLAPDKAPGGGGAATGYLAGKHYPPVNVATLGAGGAITGSAADMMAIDIALMKRSTPVPRRPGHALARGPCPWLSGPGRLVLSGGTDRLQGAGGPDRAAR